MTVGISLLTLVPGVVGGSETYARELVHALRRVGRHRYRVFTPTIVDKLPGETVSAYRASRSLPGRMLAMSEAAARGRRLRGAMGVDELDAIHFPLTTMLPPVPRTPAVVTLLDIQHLIFPEFFSRPELAYRRLLYQGSLKRAQSIIAISDHVKETLVDRLGIEPDRIVSIHLGLDHDVFRPGDEPREPFLLYPANPWPHKNHGRLFEALRLVRRQHPEIRLVLTGTGLERLETPEAVEVKGRVPREELASLYRRASAVVFPSLYEGFGQPPLEAMASGTPVASSTAGSLPEVCGDAARYFDPTSVEEMAEAVLTVLDSPDSLVERGLRRAAQFTWDETARRHDDVYASVAD
jgi:glycosyltransferase involved in cell wall biosynthesis